MKWISRCSLMLALSFIIYHPSYANQTTLIYGVENAAKVEGNVKKQFYIRAGSFANKANAKQYQKTLRSKINYPVKFSYKNRFYLITIGPINSAVSVRETANKILRISKAPITASKQSGTSLTSAPGKPVVKSVTNEKLAPILAVKSADNKQSVKTTVAEMPVQAPALVKPASPQTMPVELPKPPLLEKQTLTPKPVQEHKHVTVHAALEPHEMYKDAKSTFANLAQGQIVFTAGAGQQYPQFNSKMYVNNGSGAAPPFNRDLYTTKQNFQPLVLAALAYRIKRDNEWFSAYSLGLQYQHNFSANVGDKVLQYSDPAFYNYDASWSVASDIFFIVAKLNVFEYSIVSPYLHAGAGFSFNNAGNYSEAVRAGVTAPRVNPGFASYTTTNFAYSLGAGVDFQATPKIIISAQYQYQNLGNVKSGNGNAAWSTQSLDLGTYSTNAVLLSLSYLIDNPL